MKRRTVAFAEFDALRAELQCSLKAYAEWIGVSYPSIYGWKKQGKIPLYAVIPARHLLGHDIGQPAKWATASSSSEYRASRPCFADRNAEMSRLLQEGRTLDAIGKQFGVTRERVRQICERQGVTSLAPVRAAEKRTALADKRRARAEATREQKARFLQMIEGGLSGAAAATRIGVSDWLGQQWLRQAGIKLLRGRRKGSQRPVTSYYNAALICTLRDQGLNSRQVAAEIGAPSGIALRNWCRVHGIRFPARGPLNPPVSSEAS